MLLQGVQGRRLESLHLEFSSQSVVDAGAGYEWSTKLALPSLWRIATHLRVLCPDSKLLLPPTLTDIRILPNPSTTSPEGDPRIEAEAEEILLSVVWQVESLKSLEVPARWRSDAVERACEARGIELVWKDR